MPISAFETNIAVYDASRTGRDSPAPIIVDPAKVSDIMFLMHKIDIAGTQYSTQIKLTPQNIARMPRIINIEPLRRILDIG